MGCSDPQRVAPEKRGEPREQRRGGDHPGQWVKSQGSRCPLPKLMCLESYVEKHFDKLAVVEVGRGKSKERETDLYLKIKCRKMEWSKCREVGGR